MLGRRPPPHVAAVSSSMDSRLCRSWLWLEAIEAGMVMFSVVQSPEVRRRRGKTCLWGIPGGGTPANWPGVRVYFATQTCHAIYSAPMAASAEFRTNQKPLISQFHLMLPSQQGSLGTVAEANMLEARCRLPLPPRQAVVAPAALEAAMGVLVGFAFEAFENVVGLQSEFGGADGGGD